MTGQLEGLSALDAPTFLTVATCVTALLGLVMLFAWIGDRSIRALAWWGSAYVIGGSSVALWSTQNAPQALLPASLPTALLFVTCGMVWNGARLFQERRVLPLPLFAGAVVWLVAWSDPHFVANDNSHVVLSAVIISAYTFMTAFEFWRERRKPMFSHWSAVLVPALHAGVFLFPIPFATLGPVSLGPSLVSSGWFMLFAFETLLYAVGSACMMLLMTSERTAQMHKTAALTDPLTSLFNRRAFFEGAERLLAERTRKQRPVTVLMFDLDHFKSINDRFGHGVGDEALRIFGVTVAATMRTGDVVARLGGEEFAAILPSSLAEATMAAERVRAAYAAAAASVSGHAVGATVSIGAATAPTAGIDLGRLLGAADHALYRAKHAGRNRIEGEEVGPIEPASAPAGDAPDLVPDQARTRTRSSDHSGAAAVEAA